ncbi:MAG: hypothetical protein ABI426_09950, partial [Flavobacterium sp.]
MATYRGFESLSLCNINGFSFVYGSRTRFYAQKLNYNNKKNQQLYEWSEEIPATYVLYSFEG